QVGGLVHDLAAVVGRGRPPDRETLLGGFQRLVEIGCAGVRQVGQRLLGRRIEDVLALVAAAVLPPRAVDEKAKLAVHDTLFFWLVPLAKDLAFPLARGHPPGLSGRAARPLAPCRKAAAGKRG